MMDNSPRYCKYCQGYSAPQANVTLHAATTHRELYVGSERELAELYKKHDALLKSHAKLEEYIEHTDRKIKEETRSVELLIESMNRQREEETRSAEYVTRQLLYQLDRLEDGLMSLQPNTQIIECAEDNTHQRNADFWMSEANPTHLLIQRIKSLADKTKGCSNKIQQMEKMIDLLNLRRQAQDRTYNLLMIKHTTLMKEE